LSSLIRREEELEAYKQQLVAVDGLLQAAHLQKLDQNTENSASMLNEKLATSSLPTTAAIAPTGVVTRGRSAAQSSKAGIAASQSIPSTEGHPEFERLDATSTGQLAPDAIAVANVEGQLAPTALALGQTVSQRLGIWNSTAPVPLVAIPYNESAAYERRPEAASSVDIDVVPLGLVIFVGVICFIVPPALVFVFMRKPVVEDDPKDSGVEAQPATGGAQVST